MAVAGLRPPASWLRRVHRGGSRAGPRPRPARPAPMVGGGPGRQVRGGGLGAGRPSPRRAAARLARRARPPTPPADAGRLGPHPAATVRGDHRGQPAAPTAKPSVHHRRGNRAPGRGTGPSRCGPASGHHRWWDDRGMADRRRCGSAPHVVGPAAGTDPRGRGGLRARPGQPSGARRRAGLRPRLHGTHRGTRGTVHRHRPPAAPAVLGPRRVLPGTPPARRPAHRATRPHRGRRAPPLAVGPL